MIQEKPFGRTGHLSTRTVFGAAALSGVSQAEADRTLEVLIDYKINHIDTAASYGDAELRIGPWMKDHRDRFFLATKTERRTYSEAWDDLRRSLERLRVDHLDLWQLHNLVDPKEWEIAMGQGGALEAFIEAQEQGLVRFLGVTGHGLTVAKMHLRSLERHDFDAVLLPYNYPLIQNPQYAADFNELSSLCQERGVAVQTIKSMARGPWGDEKQNWSTWYKPYEDQADIDRAVHWVLNRIGVFLNTVADTRLLPKVLDAASRFPGEKSQQEIGDELATLRPEPLFT
ncbi:MAG: aldo/keto reductase [Anaerolineales bacterium]|jgi:aryl-alcohol dehydrogenase-like predicted oxidoreductase